MLAHVRQDGRWYEAPSSDWYEFTEPARNGSPTAKERDPLEWPEWMTGAQAEREVDVGLARDTVP